MSVSSFIIEVENIRPMNIVGSFDNVALQKTNEDLKELQRFVPELNGLIASYTDENYVNAAKWFKSSTRSVVAKYRQGLDCLASADAMIADFQKENNCEHEVPGDLVE